MHTVHPVVSIIVPVYNIEQYLPGCLDSLLCQTLSQIEILCVDDASADQSADVVLEYQARDSRVRLLRQLHGGVSAARNMGIRQARGKYLAFVDGDDFVEPDMYQKMVAAAERSDSDMVVCSAAVAFEMQSRKTRRRDQALRARLTVSHGQWVSNGTAEQVWQLAAAPGIWPFIWNKLIRTDVIREHALLFPTGLPLGEDGVFLHLLLQYLRRITFLQEPLYHYRYCRKDSATTNLSTLRMTRMHHHVCVVSESLGNFWDRGLWEKNRIYLLRWMLNFLYSDYIALPEDARPEISRRLMALCGRFELCSRPEELKGFEAARMKTLFSGYAPRTAVKRYTDIFFTKIQNRLVHFLRY